MNETVWAGHREVGGEEEPSSYETLLSAPFPPGWKTWDPWCGVTNKTPVLPNHDDKFLFATVGLNAIFRGQSYRWKKKTLPFGDVKFVALWEYTIANFRYQNAYPSK